MYSGATHLRPRKRIPILTWQSLTSRIAIHCAAGNAICSDENGGRLDTLAQEPGGYSGFKALYGHAFVAPQISPSGPLRDLDGNVITDGMGNNGFPGFGGISPSESLSYVAAMQERGVPVTFA
jgi:hypothetical protein